MSHNLTTDDWARFQNEIYSLYIIEKRPLQGVDGVMELMDSRFNFKPSKSQYEARFKEWGFEKYSKGTPAGDFKIVSYRVSKAKNSGREIRAYRRGQLVTPGVLRKRGYLTALELRALEEAPTPPTPPGFSFSVPTASPGSPHLATPSALQRFSSTSPDHGTTPQPLAAGTASAHSQSAGLLARSVRSEHHSHKQLFRRAEPWGYKPTPF